MRRCCCSSFRREAEKCAITDKTKRYAFLGLIASARIAGAPGNDAPLSVTQVCVFQVMLANHRFSLTNNVDDRIFAMWQG